MSNVIEKIVELLLDFAQWLWGSLVPPTHKPWCAVLYFVAQEDATLSYPEADLDKKLQQAVAAVKAASVGRNDLHVVYRAVWAEDGRDPVAKVVSSILGKKTKYFKGCSPTVTQPIDTGRDMSCFLDWVYRWCPADHYAVFFWGHSFGPAGLFEPGGTISLPQPGLPFLRRAFEQFNQKRAADKTPQPTESGPRNLSSGSGSNPPTSGGTGGAEATVNAYLAANTRIEVVLFQDCWMSTLETAYELRDVVSSLIASQSLVPIGRNRPQFFWPYSKLFDALATQNFADTMLATLKTFYDANFANIPGLVTVPYALVDVPSITAITVPVQNLVNAIDLALPLSTHRAQRATLFLSGQISLYDAAGNLTAGDAALVDMTKLCTALQGHSNAGIAAAATALNAVVSTPPLVTSTFESVPPSGTPVGFGGLSALYRPLRPFRGDDFITDALFDGSYNALGFPSDTGWPGTEQPR